MKLNRRRDVAVDQRSKQDLVCQVHRRGSQARYVPPLFELQRWRKIPKGDRFVPIRPQKGKGLASVRWCPTGWRTFATEGLRRNRSEEHTSELQSRENLVCR